MDITGVIKSALAPFLDILVPPACLSCHKLLSSSEEHLCPSCRASLKRLHARHPLFCSTYDRLLESGIIDHLVTVFLFEKEGVFQHLAHALKYDGFSSVGVMLGRELGYAVNKSGITADCLLPVPLHFLKRRERGFNQAESIAQGVSLATGFPLRTDLLERSRYTSSQTTLDLKHRRSNVEDAFVVSAMPEKESSCLLIDDVITTGATIIACAQALRSSGFTKIVAASLALAE